MKEHLDNIDITSTTRSSLNTRRTLVEIGNTKVKVKHTRIKDETRKLRKGIGYRGKVDGFSYKSAKALKWALDTMANPTSFVTFTFPPELHPKNWEECRKLLRNLRNSLVRRGISGIYVKHFRQDGTIHFHFVLDGVLEQKVIEAIWRRTIKAKRESRVVVHSTPVGKSVLDRVKIGNYLSKVEKVRCPQESFGDVGRYWATFGKREVCQSDYIMGDPAVVAKIVRVLRMLIKGKQRRMKEGKRFRYSGERGFSSSGHAGALKRWIEEGLGLKFQDGLWVVDECQLS